MTRPKPKFCVGEEVMIRSAVTPEYNVDRTTITKAIYDYSTVVHTGATALGWLYKTDSPAPAAIGSRINLWGESALRKIPPSDRISFSDGVWQPDKELLDG